jgi:DNA-binding MarR family transcriptional regulator
MKTFEEKKTRIVLALHQAKGPAPLGYISQQTEIEDPRSFLEQLEENDLVRRSRPSKWSPASEPRYELTDKAKEILQQLIVARLEQLVEVNV